MAVFQAMRPVSDRVDIADSFWIGPIDVDIKSVFDACEPIGFRLNATPGYGYRYCYVREVHTESRPSITWDEDLGLHKLLALSHLIHPTTASSHYSARLIYKDSVLDQIVPGRTQGYGTCTYVAREDWRDWITVDEASQLSRLFAAYKDAALPPRVKRALRHLQSAQANPYLDQKITSTVTALEALLQTSSDSIVKQFKERVPQLGRELDVALSSKDALNIYDDRSGFVHGAGIDWPKREHLVPSLYEKMDVLLRKTLVKAILDPSFAEVFTSIEAIRKSFPVCTYL